MSFDSASISFWMASRRSAGATALSRWSLLRRSSSSCFLKCWHLTTPPVARHYIPSALRPPEVCPRFQLERRCRTRRTGQIPHMKTRPAKLDAEFGSRLPCRCGEGQREQSSRIGGLALGPAPPSMRRDEYGNLTRAAVLCKMYLPSDWLLWWKRWAGARIPLDPPTAGISSARLHW
jgi:hypothetical protein